MTAVADAGAVVPASSFAGRLLPWYDVHGRKDLPWQHPRSAYRVWLSEVMLQQTQVSTVVAYFERFVSALPGLRDLAEASEDTVLALWSGLGYYRRARFLHRTARICMEQHGGELPRDFASLHALPGIGRSTAGAILAQAHGMRHAILDGNVKRVLARFHGIHGHPGQAVVERQLWHHAESDTPQVRIADYTQAIMDLGATVCVRTRPACGNCPLAMDCVARRHDLTADLPTRKPGKSTPTRSTLMLLLRDETGRILLERRGSEGVWAGLWSVPEADDIDHAWQLAQRHAQIGDATALTPFTHVFSHYRLAIEPLLFDRAKIAHAVADEPSVRWCGPEEIAALGLPAPVRRLLLGLDLGEQGPS